MTGAQVVWSQPRPWSRSRAGPEPVFTNARRCPWISTNSSSAACAHGHSTIGFDSGTNCPRFNQRHVPIPARHRSDRRTVRRRVLPAHSVCAVTEVPGGTRFDYSVPCTSRPVAAPPRRCALDRRAQHRRHGPDVERPAVVRRPQRRGPLVGRPDRAGRHPGLRRLVRPRQPRTSATPATRPRSPSPCSAPRRAS